GFRDCGITKWCSPRLLCHCRSSVAAGADAFARHPAGSARLAAVGPSAPLCHRRPGLCQNIVALFPGAAVACSACRVSRLLVIYNNSLQSADNRRAGVAFGGGIEVALGAKFSLKAEYLYYNFGNWTYDMPQVNGTIIPPATALGGANILQSPT